MPDTASEPVAVLAAVALVAAGIACLHRSWRAPARRAGQVAAGWGLLAASVVFWVRAGGVEFGPAYGCLAAGLLALGAAATSAAPDKAGRRARRPAGRLVLSLRPVPRHLLLFALAVPVAGVAAALASAAAVLALPWSGVNRMAAAVLLMPVLWGAAAYWVVADPGRYRPVAGLIAAGAAGAAALWI
ncbi:MAG: hypothetical protein GC201_14730 [Alphaproteobacteria bacterium]|nr:hypothetical protein [Alphaproteobacteria bacterium]